MDNVTHSLFALTLARTPLGRAGRGTTAALLLASNAPDIDVVAAFRGGAASYLQWHRGPTHGPFGVVGLGLLVAAVVWLVTRGGHRDADRPPASLPMLAAISMVGVLFHILMDFPTSYGTRLVSPFDWRWFAMDWLPIVDIYLLTALAAALLFGRASPEARRRNAVVALVLMAINYGIRASAHHEALAIAPRLFGPTLPQRCDPQEDRPVVDFWPQRSLATLRDPPVQRCLVELAAIPTFLSPFRWRVIAHLSNAYELHDVDLLDRTCSAAAASGAPWRTNLRFPNAWTYAVDRAAATPTAQIFLGFSRFPAARAFLDPTGAATIRWIDVRFVGGVVISDQPVGRASPFALTVRIAADGKMQEQLAP